MLFTLGCFPNQSSLIMTATTFWGVPTIRFTHSTSTTCNHDSVFSNNFSIHSLVPSAPRLPLQTDSPALQSYRAWDWLKLHAVPAQGGSEFRGSMNSGDSMLYSDRIALKFDKHLGSAAAEVPQSVKFQSDLISLTSCRLVNRGPVLAHVTLRQHTASQRTREVIMSPLRQTTLQRRIFVLA